jgi:predicted nucleic acid-binding protein
MFLKTLSVLNSRIHITIKQHEPYSLPIDMIILTVCLHNI